MVNVRQGQVISSADGMHLASKPFEHVIVDPDRDPRLPLRYGNHRTSLRLAETVLAFHGFPSAPPPLEPPRRR
jgi:hypothetical protein